MNDFSSVMVKNQLHCLICAIFILFQILALLWKRRLIRYNMRDDLNMIAGIGYLNMNLAVVATGETIYSPVVGTAGMMMDAMTPWFRQKTPAKVNTSFKVIPVIVGMNLASLTVIIVLGLTINIVKMKILTATMETNQKLHMATAWTKWDFVKASSGTSLVCFGSKKNTTIGNDEIMNTRDSYQ